MGAMLFQACNRRAELRKAAGLLPLSDVWQEEFQNIAEVIASLGYDIEYENYKSQKSKKGPDTGFQTLLFKAGSKSAGTNSSAGTRSSSGLKAIMDGSLGEAPPPMTFSLVGKVADLDSWRFGRIR